MSKSESVLGIDLGTSFVKILQRFRDGATVKAKAAYDRISPQGWWQGICNALAQLELDSVKAISLSAQVGTYIIDDSRVISWNSGIGAQELELLKQQFTPAEFVEQISMPHPHIASYPIPRLMYIKKQYPNVQKISQPKDLICEKLTGNRVTDPYSWRGLANLETKQYSRKFLEYLGIDSAALPRMTDYTHLAGCTKEADLGGAVLPAGIPVYVGLNDYFAALLGMGIRQAGDMFDISGTSEHLGVIEKQVNMDTQMVSGPYLKENVHYGVTASSGASLQFGLQLSRDEPMDPESMQERKPPIFLPYLNGERAPIWDGDARGMFFGISADCSGADLRYAVMEGVVFSLYHIYSCMGKPPAKMLKIAGGAAVNPMLNRLKADMFGIPVAVLQETDCSALGAAMVAAVGIGWFADVADAAGALCAIKEVIRPDKDRREWLEKRFSLYKSLYPAVKEQFQNLKRVSL